MTEGGDMEIARLRRLELRSVWPHETLDFTTWLEKNIDLLNESLPISLQEETVRREQAAGAFSVDLVVEDSAGNIVIIENQLEKSDHNHLGKVLTYLSSLDAKTAIWIVGEPRPEHISAVSWLNESGLASFYLYKIEVVQIGDSAAAPVLTLIVGPPESANEIASVRQEKSDRDVARRSFYDQLLEAAESETKIFSGRNGTAGPYLGASSGFAGINLVFGITMHGTSAILWIERGVDWTEWNKAVFRYLEEHKSEIEEALGTSAEWQAEETNRSRKIIVRLEEGGWMDEDAWPSTIQDTISLMLRLNSAVQPHLPGAVAAADRLREAQAPSADG